MRGGHVGQLELHGLVLADGLAEGGALLRVAKRRLEGGLGEAHRGRGERRAAASASRGSRRAVAEPRRRRRARTPSQDHVGGAEPARAEVSRAPRPRSDRRRPARPRSRRARRRACVASTTSTSARPGVVDERRGAGRATQPSPSRARADRRRRARRAPRRSPRVIGGQRAARARRAAERAAKRSMTCAAVAWAATMRATRAQPRASSSTIMA